MSAPQTATARPHDDVTAIPAIEWPTIALIVAAYGGWFTLTRAYGEWPTWIVYSAIPLGSSLMCFRFLQVTVGFLRTGELPHHDHGHVDGIDEATITEEVNAFQLEDNLHPHDLTFSKRHPENDSGKGDKQP